MNFSGRQTECQLLKDAFRNDHGRLIAVYGRRRVGKTTLVEEAYKDCILWKFEGLENAPQKKQLQLFSRMLSEYTDHSLTRAFKEWDDAYLKLSELLQTFSQNTNKPLVVFLDEFQWLCEMKTAPVSLFKFFWDNYFSKIPNCLFVICGSISSFLVRKVINSKALYGRISIELNLKPLTLAESHVLIGSNRPKREILEAYMVLGGIPQYLLELDNRQSFIQNLSEQAFSQHGFLFNEFSRLFISHFAANPIYEIIIKQLINGSLNTSNLAKSCGIELGGTFSRLLNDLTLAGFIESYHPVFNENSSRLVRYRIWDEYINFYFSFIHKNSTKIITGNIKPFQIFNSNEYKQWCGFAFERLCRKHAKLLAAKLGFAGINYNYGSWFQRGNKKQKGTQIDLLFDRRDDVLTICEMKYSKKLNMTEISNSFETKKQYIQERYPNKYIEKVLVTGYQHDNINPEQYGIDHIVGADDFL